MAVRDRVRPVMGLAATYTDYALDALNSAAVYYEDKDYWLGRAAVYAQLATAAATDALAASAADQFQLLNNATVLA